MYIAPRARRGLRRVGKAGRLFCRWTRCLGWFGRWAVRPIAKSRRQASGPFIGRRVRWHLLGPLGGGKAAASMGRGIGLSAR